jgi:predicted ester cyclase
MKREPTVPTDLEANKQLLRDYIEQVSNTGNVAIIGRFVADDFVEHYPPPGLPAGIAGAVALVKVFAETFSDYRFEIEELLAEGDRVVVRGWGVGRHTGTFLGREPTGREVRYRAAHVFQVRDGRLVGRWAYPDLAGLLQQLGPAS